MKRARAALALLLVCGSAVAQGDLRQRPGDKPATKSAPAPDPNRASELKAVPPAEQWKDPGPALAVPDRWRLLETLDLLPERWYDPYRQNQLKGDKPVIGDDGFVNLVVVSDTVYEPRRLPTPVGAQSTSQPGATGIFGGGEQWVSSQSLLFSFVYLKGDTTFKPPDFEFHFTPVYNFNYVETRERRALEIDPRGGDNRSDAHLGLQELFVDVHLRNVSPRYDFDSFRFGVQPFTSDFRGFLFQDSQLAARLFGTRDNNRWQYNLAWVRRLEKDTNSGLNDAGRSLRDDDLYVANVYLQDFPVLGHTSQGIVAHNRNDETDLFYDNNGFLARPVALGNERPRDYQVTYLGYNGDGHFGRLNLTSSVYGALGSESAGPFRDSPGDIRAAFAAVEGSIDYDWSRVRGTLLWGSGENDPFDDEANGFDAVFENPIIAGADTSYWIRQPVPLIGGGGVALSARNGVLNSLRHSKEHGQSNFTNPGIQLAGLGGDFDLLPELRLTANANHLWFDRTAVLEVARNQGSIDRAIGWDLSVALIWRPFMQQNAVVRLSGAVLEPGAGFRDLFPDETPYSVLFNLVLTY
ncbi:MAG TPA: hypothetical protein VM240_02145 [Verrucomicrobiae bacterium]|nr:hypothetical protein [Verrucomicrobiae bacterium]